MPPELGIYPLSDILHNRRACPLLRAVTRTPSVTQAPAARAPTGEPRWMCHQERISPRRAHLEAAGRVDRVDCGPETLLDKALSPAGS